MPHTRLALAGVIVAVAFISACSGSSSASSPPPAGSARDPRDLVLVAQIASGTHWDGFAEQFIKMEGVEATDGNGSTFTVSMRADATLRDYMRVRAALAATPGLSAVVERTSIGTTLGVPPRG